MLESTKVGGRLLLQQQRQMVREPPAPLQTEACPWVGFDDEMTL